jgi:glycosyltransferase involved in cell wall biosynthesis
MTTRCRLKVVACVPAYNEEKTIVRASRHLDRLLVVDSCVLMVQLW